MQNKHNKIVSTNSQLTIVSGGGASGKSHLCLTAAAKAAEDKNTRGIVFVKDKMQLLGAGGMLEKAQVVFKDSAVFNNREHVFEFTNGSKIMVAYSGNYKHLKQNYTNQFSFIAVDNAERFTEEELKYLLSRLRSTYVKDLKCFWFASPDKNSYLYKLLSNCIDSDGYVIENDNELFLTSDFELKNEGVISASIFSMTVDDNEGFKEEKQQYDTLLKSSLSSKDYNKIRYGCWK